MRKEPSLGNFHHVKEEGLCWGQVPRTSDLQVASTAHLGPALREWEGGNHICAFHAHVPQSGTAIGRPRRRTEISSQGDLPLGTKGCANSLCLQELPGPTASLPSDTASPPTGPGRTGAGDRSDLPPSGPFHPRYLGYAISFSLD